MAGFANSRRVTMVDTGQQVEVLTRDEAAVQRDWLEQSLEIVCTDRARAKLFSYFRQLDSAVQLQLGEYSLASKLQALGFEHVFTDRLDDVARLAGKDGTEGLCVAIGSGALSCVDENN